MVRIDRQTAARLASKLSKLRSETAPAMTKAMGEAADLIVATQRRLAPVDTGALRDSIQWKFGDPPADARLGGGGRSVNETRVSITAGDARAYYAAFVEHGTQSHPAQPFFYPGYRAEQKHARAIIQRGVKSAVKGAVR